MLVRRRATLELLSISALDLFASALGAFILLSLVFFPYYLKQPSLAAARDAAQRELAETEGDRHRSEEQARSAAREKAQVQALLAAAEAQLQQAESEVAAAIRQRAEAEAKAATPAAVKPTPAPVQPLPPLPERNRGIAIGNLDLVIVMDTTGSMTQELADLRANLLGLIRILERLAPSLHIGFVAYKDRGDAFVTRAFPLAAMGSGRPREIRDFVGTIKAEGGGDVPEPVEEALRAAVTMDWRPGVQGQIIVIGDAPAHAEQVATAFALAERFRGSGSASAQRSVSAIFTGNDAVGRNFFERLARSGGGDFSEHRGRMMESVLLAVIGEAKQGGGG